MSLDESSNVIVAYLAKRFICIEGFPMAISQTSEEYTTIRTCECESHISAAIELFGEILNYTRGKSGFLYWRRRPEIEGRERGDTGIYRGSARLLISSLPIRWQSMDEYEVSLQDRDASIRL